MTYHLYVLPVLQVSFDIKEYKKWTNSIQNYLNTFFIPQALINPMFNELISTELMNNSQSIVKIIDSTSREKLKEVSIFLEYAEFNQTLSISCNGYNIGAMTILQGLLIKNLKDNDVIKRIRFGKL